MTLFDLLCLDPICKLHKKVSITAPQRDTTLWMLDLFAGVH
jgi:hypothetical protein